MLQLHITYAASNQMTIKLHSREEDGLVNSQEQKAQMKELYKNFCNRFLLPFMKLGPCESSAAAPGMWHPRNNSDLGRRLPI